MFYDLAENINVKNNFLLLVNFLFYDIQFYYQYNLFQDTRPITIQLNIDSSITISNHGTINNQRNEIIDLNRVRYYRDIFTKYGYKLGNTDIHIKDNNIHLPEGYYIDSYGHVYSSIIISLRLATFCSF